jgi:GT2 family glycosyltransferase
LITCFNRYPAALRCLQALLAQEVPGRGNLSVYLVDDLSPDGTGEKLKAMFPDLNVIMGTGSLFWCRGMRLAWQAAAPKNPDFYLWLNEDTFLLPGALVSLWETWRTAQARKPDTPCLVVGACRDESGQTLTYGGQRRRGIHPAKLTPVPLASSAQSCDTFEGNLVLIPRDVFGKVGFLTGFRHAMGDTDYGYRAVRRGCQILQAPGAQAVCERGARETYPGKKTGWQGLATRASRKQLPPWDWLLFLCRHAGAWGPWFWAWTYFRSLWK